MLPSPDKVLRSLIIRSDLLFSEGWITLKETLYGFVLALVVGLPLAVAIANSRPLNLMFYPLLIALQSVPKVALAPMILVWLGTGLESKLAIVWLVAFFPIIVDTAAGLRATPKELLELAHSLSASPLQIFLKVQLPAALPFVVTGAKVAITLAVIGAVIGEFVGSSEGLGFLLLSATSQLDTPLAFAALFALSLLGIFVYALVGAGERMMAPWLPPAPAAALKDETANGCMGSNGKKRTTTAALQRRLDLLHHAPTPCATRTRSGRRRSSTAPWSPRPMRRSRRRSSRSISCPASISTRRAISGLLQVGRTPVHQALQRLELEGLVEIMPRKGVIVLPDSISEIIKILELARGGRSRARQGRGRTRVRRRRQGAAGARQRHQAHQERSRHRRFHRLRPCVPSQARGARGKFRC